MGGKGADYHQRTGGVFAPPLKRYAQNSQAAPVQNTWYPILNTTNVILYDVQLKIATTGENLEIRITADGVVHGLFSAYAAVANTNYRVIYWLRADSVAANTLDLSVAAPYGTLMSARAVLIEMRKTSANGVGVLSGSAHYGAY